MKKLLFAAILFASCTKDKKIGVQPKVYTRQDTCKGVYFGGWYKITAPSKIPLLDSLMFVRSDSKIRMEALQQTTINDTAIYYWSEKSCDSGWLFKFEQINHYVRFDGKILVDSLVVDGKNYAVNRYSKFN